MQHFLIRARKQVTEYLERVILGDLRNTYGEYVQADETILAAALEQVYAHTGKKFIFLVDEWDCVMRERQEPEALQKQYLDFLRGLLKDQPYMALAYMMGILPVKKYGVHSTLNMFTEYSMTDPDVFENMQGIRRRKLY